MLDMPIDGVGPILVVDYHSPTSSPPAKVVAVHVVAVQGSVTRLGSKDRRPVEREGNHINRGMALRIAIKLINPCVLTIILSNTRKIPPVTTTPHIIHDLRPL